MGVALAFGLTVLTMVYAIGHISGCHLNLAVSIGLWAGKRFAGKDLLPYIIVQVLGAFAAAGVLYFVASGKAGFDLATNGLAANGYGDHSPGGYSLASGPVHRPGAHYRRMGLIPALDVLGHPHRGSDSGRSGLSRFKRERRRIKMKKITRWSSCLIGVGIAVCLLTGCATVAKHEVKHKVKKELRKNDK